MSSRRVRGSERKNSDRNEEEAKKQRSSELAFAAPWLVPSPRYFAKTAEDYDNGPVVAVQPASTDAAVVARTTASSNEQKDRTPVWLAVTGFP